MGAAPSLDLLGSAARFGAALRRVGLDVSVVQLEAFVRSFAWLDPLARSDVYHAARATLLSRREDAGLFDEVFESFWLGDVQGARAQPMPLAPRHGRPHARPALAALLAQRARESDPELDVRDRSHSASADEVLRHKDFARMTAGELEALRRLFAAERWQFALRLTRRKRVDSRGRELDLRRAVARAAKHGGVLSDLPRRSRKLARRPLVVLADVSGSMELYTRVLLQFLHALGARLGVVESFVFATRLTRVTPELRLRSVDEALARVAGSVVDFASGTRIGESLRRFNVEWAPRVLRRGAVVLVISDGWEHGDAEQLAREVERLRLSCQRLIWLNPRLGHARYEPRVAGMAAALRHTDDFLTCHDMQSLSALAAHLAALPRRRRGLHEHGSSRPWVGAARARSVATRAGAASGQQFGDTG